MKRLSFPLPLFLYLFLAACGSPFAEAPPVPDSTLVSVLAELHVAEARQQMRRQGQLDADERTAAPAPSPDSSIAGVPPAVRDSILVHHRLTRAELQAALDYYARHPEQYTTLYDRVLDRLNARRTARSSQQAGDD